MAPRKKTVKNVREEPKLDKLKTGSLLCVKINDWAYWPCRVVGPEYWEPRLYDPYDPYYPNERMHCAELTDPLQVRKYYTAQNQPGKYQVYLFGSHYMYLWDSVSNQLFYDDDAKIERFSFKSFEEERARFEQHLRDPSTIDIVHKQRVGVGAWTAEMYIKAIKEAFLYERNWHDPEWIWNYYGLKRIQPGSVDDFTLDQVYSPQPADNSASDDTTIKEEQDEAGEAQTSTKRQKLAIMPAMNEMSATKAKLTKALAQLKAEQDKLKQEEIDLTRALALVEVQEKKHKEMEDNQKKIHQMLSAIPRYES